MGRPRTSGDTFSFEDLAVVAGLTKSAIQAVSAVGLLPRRDDGVSDIRTLKRVATIGAFVSAGVPLMASAQIAKAANLDFSRADGEVPSGFDNVWHHLPADEVRELPESNDYWLHDVARRHPDIYRPGRAMSSDLIYEIAEREYVLHRPLRPFGPISDPSAPDGYRDWPAPVGRIANWRRGSTAVFVPLMEDVVPYYDDEGNPTDEAKALAAMIVAARENAVGVIVVNLSLAIRNGLDRLAERRDMS